MTEEDRDHPFTVSIHTDDYAGFGLRTVAYFMDVLPITAVVVAVFYLFFGFDETWRQYWTLGGNRIPEIRQQFLRERNVIRDVAFLVYVFYSAWFESSNWQATLGKRLTGIAVADANGARPTFGTALIRNIAKFLSFLPFGLGVFWMLWSRERRTWHDMIAKTFVLR